MEEASPKNYINESKPSVKNDVNRVIEEVLSAATVVGRTFGPNGLPVLINPGPPQKQGDPMGPFFTQDGVTVIRAMRDKILRDPMDKTSLGPILLADAAGKVVEEAGDGTTTVCLLTAALLDHKADMRKDLEAIVNYIRSSLVQEATEEKNVIDVCITAIKNEILGKAVGSLVWELGENGYVRGNRGHEFKAYKIPGYSLGTGLLLPQQLRAQFSSVINHRQSITLRNPLVCIIGHDVSKVAQLHTVLTAYGKATGNRYDQPLVIVVGDIDQKPLEFIMGNFFNPKGGIPVYVVKAPEDPLERYEILTDLRFVCGNDVVYSRHSGKSINAEGKGFTGFFGEAQEATLDMNDARFVVTKDLSSRVDQIKGVSQTELTLKRISSLTGAIGVIDYNEDTEAAMKSLELQIEDGVLAAQGCLREGYICGGRVVWNALAQKFPQYAPIFISIGSKLPDTLSTDSAMVIIQSLRSAASLAGQLNDCAHVVIV